VVVSEETGTMSYAHKGQLVRGVTLEEMRAFMTSVILRPAKSAGLVRWLRIKFNQPYVSTGPAVISRREPRPATKPAPR